MSKKMAGIIMAYGGSLAALGFAIQATAPTPAQVAVLTGLTGGGACILWGVVAWCGYPRRTWVIMTMVVIALCGLSQAVPAWLALAMKSGSLAVTLLMTLMLVATVGMIMYVLHGERPPEFYEARPGRHALPGEDSSSKQPRRPH